MASKSNEGSAATSVQPSAGEKSASNPNLESDAFEEGEVSPSEEKSPIARNPERHDGIEEPTQEETVAPPLPSEEVPTLPNEEPPLPSEAPPATAEADDGWAPIWEESAQAFYFYNRFTGATQWHNPRVPEVPLPPGVEASSTPAQAPPPTGRPAGGYDPAIHGDYDESAWYAQPLATEQPPLPVDPTAEYAASAAFNRFTGRYQAADLTPENFNDENKSKRQMNAFFDVDAAANNHDGRSLKEERSGKKLSKQELKQFKEKRKAKKEEKRRAWLRD